MTNGRGRRVAAVDDNKRVTTFREGEGKLADLIVGKLKFFVAIVCLVCLALGFMLGFSSVKGETVPAHPVPETFTDALRVAAKEFPAADYKLLLCVRFNEMGEPRNEMGIKWINPEIRADYPVHTQAFQAARSMSLRAKEFLLNRELQKGYSHLGFPGIGYFCFRWAPTDSSGKNQWRDYYWCKTRGVAKAYYRYDIRELEKMIDAKEKEYVEGTEKR